MAVLPVNDSASLDDDGHPKRTGTFWTASAHIITTVIGSGVLSLAWAIAQLGWIVGPSVMLLFAFIGYYTSCLLADCYRSGDPLNGKRNHTYMHAVRSLLGEAHMVACGVMQNINLIGITIGYTIASSISMMAIKRSNCFHSSGGKNPCHISSNPFMVSFGVVEIILSQIPNFDQIWWLSTLAAIMSFTYSFIGLSLGIAKVAESGRFKGTISGVSVGTISKTEKKLRSFQALGDIAFAYSFAIVLIEIQDTIKCPPSEAKTMKKATTFSIILTTLFYLLCGCMGYAAFGNNAPGNLLTGFGFYNPFWLIDIANVAIVVHLVGAYQVLSQPIFAFVEKKAAQAWPDSPFINKDYKLSISSSRLYNINLFRLFWRTLFVCFTTTIAMLIPFFNDIVGIIGALQFWPLTVYFPIQMYIVQKKIPQWSVKWICVQTMSVGCLLVSLAAAVGSISGVMLDLKVYKPFKTMY
ncbi:amino acid permease 4-like [Cucumis melo]|uniref:Amino acid permease 4-like n=3 Tax=Cucumis melo TaxID=3656 RepID=A0A1S3B5B0_CUCME|nr:amino acid permease 4-like [Cucumis melo]